MIRKFPRYILGKKKRGYKNLDIAPDEIFVDSTNLPEYDKTQFEGRIEKPIRKNVILLLGLIFILVGLGFAGKIWDLQIMEGSELREQAEGNRLRHSLIFSDRGIIYDRNGVPLAWNTPKTEPRGHDFREYIDLSGFSNLLGFIKYPQKDSAGFYYEEEFIGEGGIEEAFSSILKGENGLQIVEIDALNEIISQNSIRPPDNGESITLTIDSRVQNKLFESLKDISERAEYNGGSGIIMNVENGEVLAFTSYPEFNSNVLTEGGDNELISRYLNDKNNPFLSRAVDGLYSPGSIVKPFIALGALTEGVVSQYTEIYSSGELVVPNPFDPSKPTIFKDNKAHGSVTIRDALAYSSNIYFYQVGGGFEGQKGIGIRKIEEYMRLFGFGDSVKTPLFEGPSGTIPNPEWKEENFDGDIWRVGDTYNTSIGQYGFQMTPIQAVRAVGAIANNGTLINPKILAESGTEVIREISEISDEHYRIVKEGMRGAVTYGTVKGLSTEGVEFAAKTGTAELGYTGQIVNSLIIGFWPYERPKYAFAIVLEQGDFSHGLGAVAVSRQLFNWMVVNTPEYFE